LKINKPPKSPEGGLLSPSNSPSGGEQARLQDVTNLYNPKRRLFPPFGGIKGGFFIYGFWKYTQVWVYGKKKPNKMFGSYVME